MTDSKLLPCPFCGGEAEIVSGHFFNATKYYASCFNSECEAEGPVADSYKRAIKAWNTRTDNKAHRMEGMLDALIDIIERKYASCNQDDDYEEGIYDAYDCIVDTTEFKTAKEALNK